MDHFVTVHLRHMAAQQPNVAQVLSLQEDFSAEWDATLTMWRVSCSSDLAMTKFKHSYLLAHKDR